MQGRLLKAGAGLVIFCAMTEFIEIISGVFVVCELFFCTTTPCARIGSTLPRLNCNRRKSRPYPERRIIVTVCRGEAPRTEFLSGASRVAKSNTSTCRRRQLHKRSVFTSDRQGATSRARLRREGEDVKKSLRLLSEVRLTPREGKLCCFVDHFFCLFLGKRQKNGRGERI